MYYLNNPLGCSKLSSRLPPSLPVEGAGLHLHGNPPATAWRGGREGALKEHSAWDIGDTHTLIYTPTGSKAPTSPAEEATQAWVSPHVTPPRPRSMQTWHPHSDHDTPGVLSPQPCPQSGLPGHRALPFSTDTGPEDLFVTYPFSRCIFIRWEGQRGLKAGCGSWRACVHEHMQGTLKGVCVCVQGKKQATPVSA